MLRFLREYWIWIAAPVVLVLIAAILALVFLDDSLSPFVYPIR